MNSDLYDLLFQRLYWFLTFKNVFSPRNKGASVLLYSIWMNITEPESLFIITLQKTLSHLKISPWNYGEWMKSLPPDRRSIESCSACKNFLFVSLSESACNLVSCSVVCVKLQECFHCMASMVSAERQHLMSICHT